MGDFVGRILFFDAEEDWALCAPPIPLDDADRRPFLLPIFICRDELWRHPSHARIFNSPSPIHSRFRFSTLDDPHHPRYSRFHQPPLTRFYIFRFTIHLCCGPPAPDVSIYFHSPFACWLSSLSPKIRLSEPSRSMDHRLDVGDWEI